MAMPAQNCSDACIAKSLACYWPKNSQLSNLQAEFEKNGRKCQKTDSKWKKDWHPAYFTNESKCFGYEDVKESSCKNTEKLDLNIARLCHCIYQGNDWELALKSSMLFSLLLQFDKITRPNFCNSCILVFDFRYFIFVLSQ